MKLRNYAPHIEIRVRDIDLNAVGLPSFDVDRFVNGVSDSDGLHVAMRPQQARKLAYKLLRLANEADGIEDEVEYEIEVRG